jgi:DNA-binding FadR family transcriptional regulator
MEMTRSPRLVEGRYTSKKDLVIAWLREAIIIGELQAGQHLRQEELTEYLGVSITPMREALSELHVAGLYFLCHGRVPLIRLTSMQPSVKASRFSRFASVVRSCSPAPQTAAA